MKEVISMWKYTRMIILVALSAAIYAAVLIVFKGGIVIVPGITELRPANVFPAIFGLMFGPAGAWGAAIGNTIGDLLGGTLGWGSLFGLVGNFYLAYLPYKLWGSFFGMVPANDMSQNTNTFRKFLAYVLINLVAAAACAIIIAWYLDLTGIVPFDFLSIFITLNNFIVSIVLGPPLLLLLYPRIKKWGLIWTDIMDKKDVAVGFSRGLGSILAVVGSLGGLIVGLAVSIGGAGQTLFGFTGNKQSAALWLAVAPFLLLIVISGFMLSGREQFTEEE